MSEPYAEDSKVLIATWVDPALRARLKALAQAQDRSMSAVVRQALLRVLSE